MTFLSISTLHFIIQYVANFLNRVVEAKILRNIQGGLDEMLIIAYMVGVFNKALKSAYVIYGRSYKITVSLEV